MGLASLSLHFSKNLLICWKAASLVKYKSLTVLNNFVPTTSSMLTKSRVTPAINAPFLSPCTSRVLLSEIPISSGGSVAPERRSQSGSSIVGLHSDHRSIRPTSGPCAIAEPANLDMFPIWKYNVQFGISRYEGHLCFSLSHKIESLSKIQIR